MEELAMRNLSWDISMGEIERGSALKGGSLSGKGFDW